MKDYDNFFLPTDDLEKSKAFYEKLGLSVKFDFSDQGMLVFKVGNQEPAIILKDTKKFPNAKPTIWFVVDDVRAEYKKLKDNGIIFMSEPFEIYTGLAAEFEDPFGNSLGITDYSKQRGNKEFAAKEKFEIVNICGEAARICIMQDTYRTLQDYNLINYFLCNL